MPDEVIVKGYTELQRALARGQRDLRLGVRRELRNVAEPVKIEAQQLATERIARIGPMRSNSWARMRVGITRKAVYVAPKQRGRASRANRRLRRPNLARLLMHRALEPALQRNATRVRERFELMLDRLGNDFNRR